MELHLGGRVICLTEVHRDALGVVMAVGRDDHHGAVELARPHLQDPVRGAALIGSLGGLAWMLAKELARREQVDALRLLQELSLAWGREDG
jgi:hypothetical protein